MSASRSTRTRVARAALLLLAIVALLAAGAVARYTIVLMFTPSEASAAFALVRAVNPLLLLAVFVAWAPLCAVLASGEQDSRIHGRQNGWRRALLPGPFGGEPARLLARRIGERRSTVAITLSFVAAYGWPFGLVASHLAHPLVAFVGAAWGSLAAVSLLLRSALASRPPKGATD